MKKITLPLVFLVVTLFLPSLVEVSGLSAQNVAITDDDTYNADSSAMLDIKSLTKGMLVPRLTTVQRNSVSSPATGLLVFDTDAGSFYFYNGTSWTNLSSGNANGVIGYTSPDKVYLSDITNKFGVGTISPIGKMEVKSDISIGNEKPIFNVVNSTGDTVFAVYEQGVRINVYDDPLVKASGNKGGFAVGGFSPAKGTTTNEYMRITPDSVRIYIEENSGAKAIGSKGGFAVGGFSPAKAGLTNEYLRITNDSTRIYTQDTIKGFGVRNIGATEKTSYMQLTPSNYFIGHESGKSNTTGYGNIFIGYESGIGNWDGWYNTAIGWKSQYWNISGGTNISLGSYSLYSNEYGHNNIAIGYYSMYNNNYCGNNIAIGSNTLASQNYDNGGFSWNTNNIAIGDFALFSNQPTSSSNGILNIAIGISSLKNNLTGYKNLALGNYSLLYNTTGFYNTSIGYSSLQANTTGNSNVAIGYLSLYFNNIGLQNTALGGRSGITSNVSNANYSGSNNTFIGFNTGFASSTQRTNATAIGYNSLVDCDNCLTLGGTGADAVKVGIGTTSPDDKLDVEGKIRLNDNDLVLRTGTDNNHGLGWYGTGKLFAGNNIDGPVLYGWSGGVLGTTNGGQKIALRWDSNSLIQIGWGGQFRIYDAGGSRYGNFFHSNNGNLHIDTYGGGIAYIDWYGGGGMAVGNGTGGAYGPVYASSFVVSSSKRFKKDIVNTHFGLTEILQLNGKEFKYISDTTNRNEIGFIAEEVNSVIHDVVYRHQSNEIIGIDYSKLTTVLVEAIKTLNNQLELQKIENSELKLKIQEIDNLKAEIEKIKQTIEPTSKK